MTLVGLLLVRNEDWIIGASLRAALQWCDGMAVCFHSCTDRTEELVWEIKRETHKDVRASYWDEGRWEEMVLRQMLLTDGRNMGGTHFAMIDADEILTANLLPEIRSHVEKLAPKEVLELPMLAMRDLDHYQDDDTVWSRAWLSLAFADHPSLTWKPYKDGYHFHHRCPYGVAGGMAPRLLSGKAQGGVMHLQWSNRRRITAKHALYSAWEWIRWPERRGMRGINQTYGEALQAPKKTSPAPLAWWSGYRKDLIDLSGEPWHEAELAKLIAERGREAFSGIDLRGY